MVILQMRDAQKIVPTPRRPGLGKHAAIHGWPGHTISIETIEMKQDLRKVWK